MKLLRYVLFGRRITENSEIESRASAQSARSFGAETRKLPRITGRVHTRKGKKSHVILHIKIRPHAVDFYGFSVTVLY